MRTYLGTVFSCLYVTSQGKYNNLIPINREQANESHNFPKISLPVWDKQVHITHDTVTYGCLGVAEKYMPNLPIYQAGHLVLPQVDIWSRAYCLRTIFHISHIISGVS